MSIRVETTYLATCDYPDCHMNYDFWELTEEDAILEVIDNGEWLCLFAGDNKPRFFCPRTCDTCKTRGMSGRTYFTIPTVHTRKQPRTP